MKSTLTFLLLFIAINGTTQYATFFANPFFYRDFPDTADSHFNHVNQMRWYINGQELRWNSDTVYIKTDLEPDTILYRQSEQHDLDTMICNIRHEMNYEFIYNACCGGFNVRWNGTSLWGSVKFIVESPGTKHYIGQVHETGKIIRPDSANVLSPYCISAMAPNIYPIALHEFRYCEYKTDKSCVDYDTLWIACMDDYQYKYDEEMGYAGPEFAVTKTLVKFLYLPLSDEPLYVRYNPKTKKLLLF